MAEPDYDSLKNKRANIKRQTTNFQTTLNSITDETDLESLDLETRLKKHKEFWNEFDEIQGQIELLKPDDFANLDAQQTEFEERFYQLNALANKYLKKLKEKNAIGTSTQSLTPSTSNSHTIPRLLSDSGSKIDPNTNSSNNENFQASSHFQLPKLPPPIFHGTYDTWLSFYDSFKSMCHDKKDLPTITKFLYLRACLKGEAAEVIASLETSESNYETAWELLKSRYDNRKFIVENHIQALFKIQSMSKEFSIRTLLDNVQKRMRELKALGESVEYWDTLLIYIIKSKLNDYTREKWEESLSTTQVPTMANMIAFLERRALLEGPQVSIKPPNGKKPFSKFNKDSRNNPKSSQAYVATTTVSNKGNSRPKCHFCSEDHALHSCNQFLKLSEQERYDVVKGTAVVEIKDQKGQFHLCRALLDSGSQCNSITEQFATTLGLNKKRTNVVLNGVENLSTNVQFSTRSKIKSRVTDREFDLCLLIFKEISNPMPSIPLDRKEFKIPFGIELADPDFHNPGKIDLLIGAEIYYDLLLSGKMRIPKQTTLLQETEFGWIIAGSYKKPRFDSNNSTKISCHLVNFNELPILWELGQEDQVKVYSNEEKECESHYSQNFERTETGSYKVKIPFNEKKENLGTSRNTAFQRFYALERKFEKSPSFKAAYVKNIQSYFDEGHLTPLKNCDNDVEDGFYLPHHAVLKQDSITTKTRVVFDGSAKTTSGISLNDTMLIGPTIQEDLFSIILRFRSFRYAMTADIEQMYRQVLIHENDIKFQKFLWREHVNEPIKVYALNRVTFGTACAPFLAIRTLHQLANDEKDSHPLAASILKSDFYVDDGLTGAQTYDEALFIRNQLIKLLKKGGFNLQKWASNHPELCEIQTEVPETHMSLHRSEVIKALGLHWDVNLDVFVYTVKLPNSTYPLTKRKILSTISKLFDPLGLLGPVIIVGKILIQQLWKSDLTWDEPVSKEIQLIWEEYTKQLMYLNQIKFDRCLVIPDFVDTQIHGFCDASEKAYGACIYLRSTNSQGVHKSSLICSKSRVTPIKATTLSRLELCAATLLVQLYSSVVQSLKMTFSQVVFWSDSTIVLNWINTPSALLKTFVANRVSQIQEKTNSENWRHVRTHDNPADIISRGQSPQELVGNKFWTHGPNWLEMDEKLWPQFSLTRCEIPEKRKVQPLVALKIVQQNYNLLEKFSDWKQLVIVVAYFMRFIKNAKLENKSDRVLGRLSPLEFNDAILKIMKLTQRETFLKEIQALEQGKDISQKSSLLRLNLFLEKGIIRVGVRLGNAEIPNSQKHPIVLPKSHHVTGRNTTRHFIRQCFPCFRAKPREPEYLMGNLPRDRVSFSRAFTHAGVDYCGPFFIKEESRKATKAVHLELASDLTTDAFFAVLKRFCSRRGIPNSVSPDNATNFAGTRNELRELYKTIETHEKSSEFHDFLLINKIKWHFIPPRAPHFGGLWEASVKSFKHHFTRVTGTALLTYEQLHTYVVEIEATLNSRPLTPLSSDLNDFLPLTPSHFLIGNSLTSIPQDDLRDIPSNRLNCWQHAQQMRQQFWDRWH
ncbi:uncharacterized protein LOC127285377 [Leptopilina boulardi]|uniref:uncharacterized protein LOC127285377 n=1 Tax=Leptopilina boulardi TaxID=63433 RepID=UPI0021F555EB|nr:uncharacterized protein LOC127285377 [Leptopilina boulardi]